MKPMITASILNTLRKHGDLSTAEIASKCHLSYQTTRKYLLHMLSAGEVEVRGRGILLYTVPRKIA